MDEVQKTLDKLKKQFGKNEVEELFRYGKDSEETVILISKISNQIKELGIPLKKIAEICKQRDEKFILALMDNYEELKQISPMLLSAVLLDKPMKEMVRFSVKGLSEWIEEGKKRFQKNLIEFYRYCSMLPGYDNVDKYKITENAVRIDEIEDSLTIFAMQKFDKRLIVKKTKDKIPHTKEEDELGLFLPDNLDDCQEKKDNELFYYILTLHEASHIADGSFVFDIISMAEGLKPFGISIEKCKFRDDTEDKRIKELVFTKEGNRYTANSLGQFKKLLVEEEYWEFARLLHNILEDMRIDNYWVNEKAPGYRKSYKKIILKLLEKWPINKEMTLANFLSGLIRITYFLAVTEQKDEFIKAISSGKGEKLDEYDKEEIEGIRSIDRKLLSLIMKFEKDLMEIINSNEKNSTITFLTTMKIYKTLIQKKKEISDLGNLDKIKEQIGHKCSCEREENDVEPVLGERKESGKNKDGGKNEGKKNNKELKDKIEKMIEDLKKRKKKSSKGLEKELNKIENKELQKKIKNLLKKMEKSLQKGKGNAGGSEKNKKKTDKIEKTLKELLDTLGGKKDNISKNKIDLIFDKMSDEDKKELKRRMETKTLQSHPKTEKGRYGKIKEREGALDEWQNDAIAKDYVHIKEQKLEARKSQENLETSTNIRNLAKRIVGKRRSEATGEMTGEVDVPEKILWKSVKDRGILIPRDYHISYEEKYTKSISILAIADASYSTIYTKDNTLLEDYEFKVEKEGTITADGVTTSSGNYYNKYTGEIYSGPKPARIIDHIVASIHSLASGLNGMQNIRFSYGFFNSHRRDCVYYFEGKKFDEPLKFTSIEPANANRDGAIIRQARKILSKEKSDIKILIFISDSTPRDDDNEYYGKRAVEDVRHAFLELKNAGILFFVATVPAYKYYGFNDSRSYLNYLYLSRNNYQVIKDVTELDEAFSKFIKTNLPKLKKIEID